jgi:putative sterol carrier protein
MAIDLNELTVQEIWEKIEKQMNAKPEPYADLNAVYQFDLTGDDGGIYQLQLENGAASTSEGEKLEPSCTLQMKVSDFKKFLAGNMNSTAAFMMGKLKVKGNISLALKLDALLGKYEFE